MRTPEDVVDPNGPPPWLHLLSPQLQAWRETQILKGRNPDPYIIDRLKEAGDWPNDAGARQLADSRAPATPRD